MNSCAIESWNFYNFCHLELDTGHGWAACTMHPLTVAPATIAGATDECPRVKVLCSFGGSILPRPLDGKLRYVGGETRIITLQRDITYGELMRRMKELFGATAALKYQQPEEDLDALVSVVNDDDVTNMMEEYDKVGRGEGFNRVRLFLFSISDDDMARFESDEKESERRYVEALNSLNDSPLVDNRSFTGPEPFISTHLGPPPSALNLHHLAVPHSPLLAGMQQQPNDQRYSPTELDSAWSPTYYSSPRFELPPSPSSARYRMEFFERTPDDYGLHAANHQCEHQPLPSVENLVWVPQRVVGIDKGGFPGNLSCHYDQNSIYEGSNLCERCRMIYQRHPDPRRRHDQWHMEHGRSVNELPNFANACPECFHGREAHMLNQESPRHVLYNEPYNHERGVWVLHPQLSRPAEELRTHAMGVGMNGHITDIDKKVPLNCTNICDAYYVHSGAGVKNAVFHGTTGDGQEHTPRSGPFTQLLLVEENCIYHGNDTSSGVDNPYQKHESPPVSTYRKVHNTACGLPHETPIVPQANDVIPTGYSTGQQEASPIFSCSGLDDEYIRTESSTTVFDSNTAAQMTSYISHLLPDMSEISVPNPSITGNCIMVASHGGHQSTLSVKPVDDSNINEQICVAAGDGKRVVSSSPNSHVGAGGTEVMSTLTLVGEYSMHEKACETGHVDQQRGFDGHNYLSPDRNAGMTSGLNNIPVSELEGRDTAELGDSWASSSPMDKEKLTVQNLGPLSELITLSKESTGGRTEQMNIEEHGRDSPEHELEPTNDDPELKSDSDKENLKLTRIEPTEAEAEALSRGLQTIRNDDLEEVRELGSGTYGAVYHGKWKGSDVAIKRIKANCFAGRPSERERLIADFWKEALILSSLHHPNVVSFYGIVRDGPDGTLATVTEFMINGSLKQFLQKKDRTIDRRKRIIIAMDVAFGMEYLHGKNIVHFDLKCENLLVNMRDHQRPVCKIGDLGLSKVKQHTLVSGGIRGTLPWMAPELLGGKSNMVTEKVDAYSFGVVMWELLTGDEPYSDMHCASIIGGIVNNTLRPQIPSWCDPEWKCLMENCWCSDPGERPSFSEISQRLRKMAAAINVK